MLFRKQGFPDESELVVCTVTKVNPNSVFVNLDEYDKSGLVHISEVSPGRIRNIRDYVREGKLIICKVLSVDKERGHIDLSLRRVTETQRRAKVNQIKQEQKAEKIVELVARQLKRDFKELYGSIAVVVLKHYESVHDCFEDVVLTGVSLQKLGVEKQVAEELEKLIPQRIKKPEVVIQGDFTLTSFKADGIEVIKKAIKQVKDKQVEFYYEGAGKYRLALTAADYKEGEKKLKENVDKIVKFMEKNESFAEFKRIEK